MTRDCLAVVSLSVLLLLPTACMEEQRSEFFSISLQEMSPGERQLLHYPPDGLELKVNPPGFTWTEHPDADQYRLVLFKEEELANPVLVLDALKSTIAALETSLEAGNYRWMVLYEDSAGTAYGRSQERGFTVPERAQLLPMPAVSEMKNELAGLRPRIFLTPDRIKRIQSAVADERIPLWDTFESLLEKGLKEPLYPEPEPYKNGDWSTPEWRRIYTPAKIGTSHMVRLALAYKLMDNEVYLKRAKEWLLHLSSWDPRGICSHGVPQPDGSSGNDEASMPMLERMAITYDWIQDELTDEEKRRVHASITERGNQVLALLHKQDFLSKPFSNHEGRVLAFLGLAGLSFLDVVPDAERWLDYVLRCYLTSYPVWGGDDGGWAQGLSYWSSYVMYLTECADALRSVTDVDIYRRPFFRNTGYFALYFLPPYASRGAFGDGSGGPSLSQKLLVKKFAAAFNDPVLLWHSEQIPVGSQPAGREWNQWVMEDVHSVLDAAPADLEPKPPLELPSSRWLKNLGWVAAHSRLGDAEEDVWVLFKSSRFGSFSHSHADQNSFQLNAYGEALLIDSGYYPWYGSPHHTLWTRQTRAHNAILIDGRGHSQSSMAARGTIEYFEQMGNVTKVLADAAEAYNVPLTEGAVELWKQTLKEPVPAMEPKAEVARRALAFVVSEDRPWLAVQDYLRTDQPAEFQYLLHALNEMDLDQDGGKITVHSGDARLDIYLMSDLALRFSQTDQFPVPPEERYEGANNQFHFTAATDSAKEEARFLAVYVPYRSGESPPVVRKIEAAGSVAGFQVGEDLVTAWWGPGEVGTLSEQMAPGRLLVESMTQEGRKTVLLE